MKNAFYFILKALLFLRYLNFCPDFFGHVGKRLHEKPNVTFKIYDATDSTTSNYNSHIARYLKKGNQTMKFDQLIELSISLEQQSEML